MAGLADWAKSLLEGRRHAVLATQDEDGGLHMTPVWYLFSGGELFVGCNSASRKAKNAAARPTASILVEVRDPGTERWVSGIGPASMLRGEESRKINAAIVERYLTPEAIADPRIGPAFAAVDDVTLRIRPTKWRSWASEEVDKQFFAGILGASPKKWFRALD